MNFSLKAELQLNRASRSVGGRRTFNDPAPNEPKAQPQFNARSGQKSQPNSAPLLPTPDLRSVKLKAPARENPYSRPSTIKCFRCLQPGLKSNEFPTRPQMQLLEGEVEANSTSKEDADHEEEFEEIGGDEGEPVLCVMQKIY